jgi:hypothetical protein
MNVNRWLSVAAVVAALSLGTVSSLAQNQGGGGGRRGGGNFDPAQFRERMMERAKETLEVTDDNEWKALQPLVQKVMDARMAAFSGGRGGMFGRRGGGPGGGADNNNNGGGNRPQIGQPNPDADALQRAIDGKASNAELKAAIAKFQESRKAKQAELEKAQAELRKVLSVRQEAIATANGWL